jgi:alginate O-acetyltransferase complex protein AlgI
LLFNSFEFLLFFPIVTVLFFLLPHKFRWFHLLAASCYFYMAFVPVYILILFFTIIIDYIAGICIESAEGKRRKVWLVMSLIANIGVLAYFKYYNFLVDNINQLLPGNENAIPYLKILLPIGLSFHTFQAMSYTIEVYRGNQKAERHFGIYALYVMFYPQLVAGPIERPQNILHQFHEKKYFNYDDFRKGMSLILYGLVKKVVIADRLSPYVDQVYQGADNMSFIPTLLAVIFFSIQIYCDFSGYSDIALGTARCMGFDLMKNFDHPYRATSIADFWRRWHISLSTWFKDYLYIPLGGSKSSAFSTYRNLFIVFLISGLWHGASWTFIAWGLLHALFQVVESLKKKYMPGLRVRTVWVNQFVVFTLVSIAWVFFRAANFTQGFTIIKTSQN